MHTRTRYLTQAALIAAIYVALTLLMRIFGLDSGAIQLRLSEALTVLPFFTSAAVPGLTVGCLLANLFVGGAPWDIVFGTLATLLGALGTRALRRSSPYLASIPPIVSNTLIVPWVIRLVYGDASPVPFLMLTVGIGEVLSAGVCGTVLLFALKRCKGIKWA
ncbi:MAG: QueT transporter family protein [Clostridia bacterium]|nr:QueT transporter family protein [Clostridia bacterium]